MRAAAEIEGVIHALCSPPPSVQLAAIDRYFTPDADFTHPFCRTLPSPTSRFQLSRSYRWYKILSPQISVKVHSVAWDESNSVLYVGISQVFAIWFYPFHQANARLVTVLRLVQHQNRLGSDTGGKWYIKSQNDLYQTDQFLKFPLPLLGPLVMIWQYFATLVCIVCSYIFEPVSWWEESKQKQFERKEIPPVWNAAK